MDFLWLLLLVVIVGGLWFFAYRMEPHWSSKDGSHFMCTTQTIWADRQVGKNKETHIAITPDGLLLVQDKTRFKRERSFWKLAGKSDSPPKGKQIYVAVPSEPSGGVGVTQMTIHIPNNSKVVGLLEGLLEQQTGVRPSPSTSESAQPADPPDQD